MRGRRRRGTGGNSAAAATVAAVLVARESELGDVLARATPLVVHLLLMPLQCASSGCRRCPTVGFVPKRYKYGLSLNRIVLELTDNIGYLCTNAFCKLEK